ncbi:MAG: isoleucine--tRNA ligase [Candidatus Omnitrophica bacterium]|nr:isoleucine--tRNA ligase [Candidatus Omnitrophota bacterium]
MAQKKNEYKQTLNLPRTSFSMKANLGQMEPRMLDFWTHLGLYGRLRQDRARRPKFILHDGPPYANGLIHIGHALNKILKDIILKHKTLQGYDCPFLIGWDCHGLPVEHQLFKKLKKTKHDVEVLEFRKQAEKFALRFVDLQKKDFMRLGVVSDWEHPYLTLQPRYESAVISLLEFLTRKGYVYRGRKPVNWCAQCETALAEAEVEYDQKQSDSLFCLFPVRRMSGRGEATGQPLSFLVWTTTPWTLVSNVAVAVHPDLEYAVVESCGGRFIAARELVPSLEKRAGKELTITGSVPGRQLQGTVLEHPFLDREAPVVTAEFVSKEEGSGCVHIAPGHGAEDFSLTRIYDLPIRMPVNDKGVFEEPEEFRGKTVSQAGKEVIRLLEEKGRVYAHAEMSHSYPHCWRCKQPIIFRATSQWFVHIDHAHLREKVLESIDHVRWVPPGGRERMRSMVSLRPDWCLSRQRLWGIPIPAVRCRRCGSVLLEPDVLKRTAEVFAKRGANSWVSEEASLFVPEQVRCGCGSREFEKLYDILDVWFESGASFLAVVKGEEQLSFPADLYLEGSDQHRGWFQVSLIPSVAREERAPFKTILTHGFVVDGEGRKMSKSLGNSIAPQEVIKKYGAEILRLWVAYSDYREDVKISEEILKQLVDVYRKVRNTIRFAMGNLADFPADYVPDTEVMPEVDRYMLARAALLQKEVTECYEQFAFYRACQKIFNFCNLEMSSFYLDILKDRLYTFYPDSPQRRSAQYALRYSLQVLLKLIAPVLSFTAEEAYQHLDAAGKKESLFFNVYAENRPEQWADAGHIARWEKILGLRGEVLKLMEQQREQGAIGSSLEAEVGITLPGDQYRFFHPLEETLREVLIVSSVRVLEGERSISVEKAKGQKCPRCWNWRIDIGGDDSYPELCGKCAQALKEGEANEETAKKGF